MQTHELFYAVFVNNRATPLPWTKLECGKRYYVLCQAEHTPPHTLLTLAGDTLQFGPVIATTSADIVSHW